MTRLKTTTVTQVPPVGQAPCGRPVAVAAEQADDGDADQPRPDPGRGPPVDVRPALPSLARSSVTSNRTRPMKMRDEQLQRGLEAAPVDDQVGDDETERDQELRERHAVGARAVRVALLQRGQRDRGEGVHDRRRAGDEVDQRAPARERQERELADDEGQHDRTTAARRACSAWSVCRCSTSSSAQRVGEARRRAEVDQAGAAGETKASTSRMCQPAGAGASASVEYGPKSPLRSGWPSRGSGWSATARR